MAAEGLRGASRAKKRFTTKADPAHGRAPDLVGRNFVAERPDALWVADFTYCSTWSGIVYVAFIVDVYSRRIVGWKAARSMTTALVLDALNMAARGPGATLPSTGSCATTTPAASTPRSPTPTDSTRSERRRRSAPSRTATTTPWPNQPTLSTRPSCTATPATLAANGGAWKGLDDLEVATAGWVAWFNTERLHGALDDRTPAEVEAAYHRAHPRTDAA